MQSLTQVFEFEMRDIEINANEKRILFHQKDRLESVFIKEYKSARKELIRDMVIVIAIPLGLYFIGRTIGHAIATLLLFAILITSVWDEIFGKYNVRYLYRRIGDVQRQSRIHVIESVNRSGFMLKENIEVYSSHRYSQWFKTYKWSKEDTRSYTGWYEYQGDKDTELIIAPVQFSVLRPDINYNFYCYLDPRNVAYVLSVEEQSFPNKI